MQKTSGELKSIAGKTYPVTGLRSLNGHKVSKPCLSLPVRLVLEPTYRYTVPRNDPMNLSVPVPAQVSPS